MENIHLPTLALILIIGGLGEVAKSIVGAKAGDAGWRGVYYVTYRAHGIFVGALLAALAHSSAAGGVDVPLSFGTGVFGAVLWGAASGGASMALYTSTIGVIRARIKHMAER